MAEEIHPWKREMERRRRSEPPTLSRTGRKQRLMNPKCESSHVGPGLAPPAPPKLAHFKYADSSFSVNEVGARKIPCHRGRTCTERAT
ncbi:hypothetical protein EVAR_82596_1 [Eumeta japonica]|uniref:Uncharacterized protein n=1 Tax=Eumeta variegata TaxID=151549 RepID=A0A4C1X6F7_EUMVA|nr:hypothetical protein EVAR_82596_1 [Eumeta japonica]